MIKKKVKVISSDYPGLRMLVLSMFAMLGFLLIAMIFSAPVYSKEKKVPPVAAQVKVPPAPKVHVPPQAPRIQAPPRAPRIQAPPRAPKMHSPPSAPKAQRAAPLKAREMAPKAAPRGKPMDRPGKLAQPQKRPDIVRPQPGDRGIKQDLRPGMKAGERPAGKREGLRGPEGRPGKDTVGNGFGRPDKGVLQPGQGRPGKGLLEPGKGRPDRIVPSQKEIVKAGAAVGAAGLVAGKVLSPRQVDAVPLKTRLAAAHRTHECFLRKHEFFNPIVFQTLLYIEYLDLTIVDVDYEVFDQLVYLTNLDTLRLYGGGLTYIPDSIDQLTNLETLDLSGMGLRELSLGVTRMTNLERLILDDNRLRTLPPEIANLVNLRSLSVERNRLRFLPVEITTLSLAQLYLAGNPELDLASSQFQAWLQNLEIHGADIDLG